MASWFPSDICCGGRRFDWGSEYPLDAWMHGYAGLGVGEEEDEQEMIGNQETKFIDSNQPVRAA